MTALDVFSYSGQQVRTVLVDGEPWFVAADVCEVLGIANASDALGRVDTDGVGTTEVIDSMGRTQRARTVNEPGLYELVFLSRKPEAKAFKRWVTGEVLPQIRRTGKFAATEPEHALPQSYSDALRELAASVEAREQLEAKVAADAPKVDAWHRFMDAEGYYDLGTVARILGMGRTTFCNALRNDGIFRPGGTQPYQRWMHHFVVTTSTYTTPDGHVRPTSTTRVLPSGVGFLARRLGVIVNGELEPVA